MRVAIGADHAGYPLKQLLIPFLESLGYSILDLGTNSTDPVDYPDYSEAVGLAVLEARADRGILICGSGVGASVAANKLPGIRAGIAHDTYSAHQGVEHDNMNILVLGSRVIGVELAKELAATYLRAIFSNEPRHVRRLAKVKALEVKYGQQSHS
jgi:RpiB/LacA/LacB family sugar-phosphate isomerase